MDLRTIKSLVDKAANELTSPSAPGTGSNHQSKQCAKTLGYLQARLDSAIAEEGSLATGQRTDSVSDVRLLG